MKLKTQLLLITAVFVTPPLFMATLMLFDSDDAAEVNMSGRQRMLSQKLTKEILTFNLHRSMGNEASLETDLKQIQSTMKLFEKTLNALTNGGETSKTLDPTPNDQLLKKPDSATHQQLMVVRNTWNAFKKLVEQNIQQPTPEVLSQILTDNLNLLKQSNAAVALIEKGAKQRTQRHKIELMSLCLVSLILGIAFQYYGLKYLRGPLLELDNFLKQISEGDLSNPFNVHRRDVIGRLQQSAETMRTKLAAMISELKSKSQLIANNAENLEGTTETLKNNASANDAEFMMVQMLYNEVQASLQQVTAETNVISASIEQSTASGNQIASNILHIEQNCHEERDLSEQSGRKSEQAAEYIAELGHAAKEISSIIDLITSIAEQTNLLALNATIEAASAGEAGKGFAVVAEEVKELARQTGNATERISDQIHRIQNDTDTSVTSVNQIRELIQKVNETSTHIFESVRDQRRSSDEMKTSFDEALANVQKINEDISDLSKRSQEINKSYTLLESSMSQIASDSEDTASSAEEISTLTKQLDQMIAQFKLA